MFKKLAVLVVVSALCATGVQAASLMFPARNDTDAGFNFGDAHVGVVDVDGDGLTDYVVVTLEQGEQLDVNDQSAIAVFPADGRGLFDTASTQEISLPLNSFPGKVAVGDFDNDGSDDDFAVAVEDLDGSVGNTNDVGGVLVYTFDDVDTFSLFETLTGENAEPGFTGIAAGSFGGSAADDIVMLNSQSNTFTVFLSAPGPTFGAGTDVATCTTPVAIDAGEIRPAPGDDLAIACDPIGTGDEIRIYENNGAGTFSECTASCGSPLTPADMVDPRDLILVDLNNDAQNVLDMAIANSHLDAASPSGTISLLMGDGVGGFTSFTASGAPVGQSPVSIDAGDVDGDGVVDLLTANLDDEDISVLTGSLLGSQPTYSETFFAGGFPTVEALFTNLDDVANLDVVATNPNESTAVLATYIGDSSAPLHAAQRYFPTDSGGQSQIFGANAMAIGDFDSDGLDDLAVANALDDSVSVFYASPGGGDPFVFADLLTVDFGDIPFDVLAEDVNGDSADDIVVLLSPNLANGEVATFINSNNTGNPFPGTPNFRDTVGMLPWSMARGDVDGDTVVDIAVTNLSDQTVTLLRGLNTGDYDNTVLATVDTTDGVSPCADGNEETDCDPNGVALANIDTDTDMDMVVSRFGGVDGGSLKVWTNDFSDPNTPDMVPGQVLVSTDPFGDDINHQTVFLQDLDGGNGPDILAVGLAPDDFISVFLNNGSGTFAPAPGSPFLMGGIDAPTPDGPRNATLADVNMDGISDLTVTGFFSNNVGIMLGVGDGTFAPARADAFGTTQGPLAVGAGDFTGNGLTDLAAVGLNDDVAALASGLAARGDLDFSGRVDGFDLAALNRLFGVSSGDMAYDFYFDIDADGDIDGDDLNLLSVVFGLTFF